jgi:hypothetical protein
MKIDHRVVNLKVPESAKQGPKPSIFFATPTKDGQVFDGYSSSETSTALLLNKHGISCQFVKLRGDPSIVRARNLLVDAFMRSNCSHMFWIDADQGWDPEGVLKILGANEDFTVGLVRVKNDTERYAANLTSEQDRGMVRLDSVGLAFASVYRGVYERMFEAYPNLKTESFGDQYGYHLFEETWPAGVYHSEDITFCNRWTAIGGRIWAVPDIDLEHYGPKLWQGNFDKFLDRNAETVRVRTIKPVDVDLNKQKDIVLERMKAMGLTKFEDDKQESPE